MAAVLARRGQLLGLHADMGQYTMSSLRSTFPRYHVVRMGPSHLEAELCTYAEEDADSAI